MTAFRMAVASRLVVCPFLAVGFPAAVAAQSWESPLLGRELVIIEKTVAGDDAPAAPLPSAVRAGLGQDFVEYETFVAAVLPAAEAKDLAATALAEGRGVLEDPRSPVVLPFHSFQPENPEERTAPWAGYRIQPRPVPDLFLLRFAFPLLEEWAEGLRSCGADPILYYGNGVFLTRAKNMDAIKSCPAARYISWADDFLTTDRTSPALLDTAGLEMKPYSLTFIPGTDLATALAELPAVVEVGSSMTWDDGTLSLGVLAGGPELEDLMQTSQHLLAIQEADGEPEPSDERQGQIVAGNYAGYSNGAVTGAVTSPGYLTWLANRGLRTATGQPTVAVFDTGYDDGSGVAGAHHPDLETPERLVDEGNYVLNWNTPAIEDTRGHGTMVAGIIAGDGTRSGAKDNQNFYLGTGIAPDVKLVAVQVMDSKAPPDCGLKHSFTDPPTKIDEAIRFSRVTAAGADKAVIGNHSWNVSLKSYDSMARLFDQRVIDGAPDTAGFQPMAMVVAAGNGGTSGQDSVASPATAKNVITVGATQNYRPSSENGAPTNECTLGTLNVPAYTMEANNIAQVSTFSSQGAQFGARGQGKPLITNVRVKPDLVAPGGRVFSTVPYQSETYSCQALCRMYWPIGAYHSFSSGTSFSTPVVTGVAALARKWFVERGVQNPSPSLLKASLIATATDLGPAAGGDHRPSYKFGWGRVNLERLTDSTVARFYVNEGSVNAVSTGQEWTATRTVDKPGKPIVIVLAWSDPASPVNSTSQAPLINDLRLSVESVGGNSAWHGNNFEENIDGNDSGYSHRYPKSAAAVNDTLNTVEVVVISPNTFSAGQKIVIRVKGANVRSGSQKYTVYAYNVRLNS